MNKLLTAILITASITAFAHHDGHHEPKAKENKPSAAHHSKQPPHMPGKPRHEQVNISPKLRNLLNMEMQQIKGGMESLVFANVSGNWDQIYQVGSDIKRSYIMAQKLTKEQRKELKAGLPHGFKLLDKKFHAYAGNLANAAKKRDSELVNYYIYKMNETCSACHSQYAPEKFPGFNQQKPRQRDHH